MTRFTMTATRVGDWWALECLEVPGALTQVRDLAEAESMMREAIAFVAEVPEDSFEVVLVR
jgi:predicted RNase H-like HicB family nuclease